MKYSELAQKSKEELLETLNSLSKDLFNLRMQRVMGEFNDTSELRKIKKDIARLKTKLNNM